MERLKGESQNIVTVGEVVRSTRGKRDYDDDNDLPNLEIAREIPFVFQSR